MDGPVATVPRSAPVERGRFRRWRISVQPAAPGRRQAEGWQAEWRYQTAAGRW